MKDVIRFPGASLETCCWDRCLRHYQRRGDAKSVHSFYEEERREEKKKKDAGEDEEDRRQKRRGGNASRASASSIR